MAEDTFSKQKSVRGGFDRLVIFAAVSAAASIGAAKYMAQLTENGDFPVIAMKHSDVAMKRLAKATPAAQPNGTVTIVRSIGPGVDGTATATIRSSKGVTPCSDQK
jgi:hypothetical protein